MAIKVVKEPCPKPGNLGRAELYANAIGTVIGAGIITLVIPAFRMTGYSAWIAYLCAILFGFISMLPIIFISSTLRVGGGFGSLVVDLAGPRIGCIYQMLFYLNTLSCSVMCVSATSYFADLFPVLNNPLGKSLTGAAIVLFFVMLNLFGVDVFAKLQKVMTWILIAALLMFIAFGIPHFHLPVFDFSGEQFLTNGWVVLQNGMIQGGFIAAIFLFIYSCNGYKGNITYGRYAKNAQRDMPWVYLMVLPTLIVLYLGVTIVATGGVPLEEYGSSNTLVVAAKQFLPGILYPLFIICGPLMALFTTINANFSGYGISISQSARDGWIPAVFAKTNKRGAPWVVYLAVAIVGVTPVLLNFSISTITNNLQLVTSLIGLIMDFSLFTFPTRHPEAWKKSKMHVPNSVYYALCSAAMAVQLTTFIKSCMSLQPMVVIVSLSVFAVALIAGVKRGSKDDVTVKVSVWELGEEDAVQQPETV